MPSFNDVFLKRPETRSPLGLYRMLSPSASIRVSQLCLGTMNFGDAWESFMGCCNKETSFSILDYFYEQGGNFIDTANNYQAEESEKWIGEWMEERGVRDQIVLATKYTTAYRAGYGGSKGEILANTTGNGIKSMRTSVDHSLKKLKTDYIDILYVHWWDYTASVEEVMQGLNQLVNTGKVLYLGVSDTPAWIVSKANQYARDHGLRQFVVYQGKWSAESRDFERDIIPMCIEEKMGFCPWGALGGGNFKTDEQRKSGEGRKMGNTPETAIKVSKVLETVANRHSTVITSIALAYVMAKTANVFPIVGGRKIEHLKGNIEALKIKLTEDDMAEIEGAIPFEIGFPQSMISRDPAQNWLLIMAEETQYHKDLKPLQAK